MYARHSERHIKQYQIDLYLIIWPWFSRTGNDVLHPVMLQTWHVMDSCNAAVNIEWLQWRLQYSTIKTEIKISWNTLGYLNNWKWLQPCSSDFNLHKPERFLCPLQLRSGANFFSSIPKAHFICSNQIDLDSVGFLQAKFTVLLKKKNKKPSQYLPDVVTLS